MMDGLVVKRGTEYLARKTCKSTYADDCGWCWSTELQAARIYRDGVRHLKVIAPQLRRIRCSKARILRL